MEEIGDIATDAIQQLGGVEVVLVLNLILTVIVLVMISDVRSTAVVVEASGVPGSTGPAEST